MPYLKFVNQSYGTVDDVDRLLRYVLDYSKSRGYHGTRGFLLPVQAQDLLRSYFLWRKSLHSLVYHWILSFADNECILAEEALEIASRFAGTLYPKWQSVFGVHTTQAHMHVHFIICRCSPLDGTVLELNYSNQSALRQCVEQITNAVQAGVMLPADIDGEPTGLLAPSF